MHEHRERVTVHVSSRCKMSLLALHYHFHVQTHRTDARTLIMNTFLAPFSCDAAHVAHKHRSMHILATYAAPPCLPHNAVRSSARVTRADAAPPLRDHHSGRACSPTAARHISSEAHGAARATRPLTLSVSALAQDISQMPSQCRFHSNGSPPSAPCASFLTGSVVVAHKTSV